MAEAQQTPAIAFSIEKIYIKDLSVEVPNAPSIFLEREMPEIGVDLSTRYEKVSEEVYECVVKVTVSAKFGERTGFLIECEQAGIFRIAGLNEEQLSMALGIGCPNMIFPYIRETVSDVVLRAGFPPLQLAPFNFEAEYAAHQHHVAAQGQEATH